MSPQTQTVPAYHRATSYRRHRLTPHSLDWAHQPVPVKAYPELPRLPLDRGVKAPTIDYFELLQRQPSTGSARAGRPDLEEIATALHLTHAVTARSAHAGQPFYYRSVASAGALYPFELYLAVNQVQGLDPGVYHYDLFDFCLNRLRRGRVPEIPPVARGVAATFFICGIFFRSAWKYRSRAYRYVLLDAGHLLENLRLALGALKRAFSIHLDFDDGQAATLLGLDPEREVCLACVHLHADSAGEKKGEAVIGQKPLSADIRRASAVSDQEVAYGEILSIHRAGNAAGSRSIDPIPALDVLEGRPEAWIDLDPPDHRVSADYAHVLRQRRSRRNFIPAPVSRESLMAFMGLLTGAMGHAAGMPPACRSALATGVLAGANMPVPPGFYLLNPATKRMGQILNGLLIEPMAAACLDQMWLKHAGLHLLFTTDLAALDRNWGARGYRYAMIEAGRLGQQAYLAATALGWGACGIGAIYDSEAAQLIDLTTDAALLYLVGVGPVKTR